MAANGKMEFAVVWGLCPWENRMPIGDTCPVVGLAVIYFLQYS